MFKIVVFRFLNELTIQLYETSWGLKELRIEELNLLIKE